MRFSATLPAAFILAFSALLQIAAAQALLVPQQFPTIQGAIVAAQPGDTVLVAAGTYVEHIDFLGKNITVVSEDGPQVTTIDGAGSGGSVVTFVNGESSAAVLEGFTVTNGVGTLDASFLHGYAGGISCDGSSPTINRCIVTGNVGKSGSAVGGPGGIASLAGGAPTIANCLIHGNTGGSSGLDCGTGGVAALFASAAIINTTIVENAAGSGPQSGAGGIQTIVSPITLINSIVWNNTSTTGTPSETANLGSGGTSATFSNVRGGLPGAGNIDADPFLDSSYRLTAASPCLDAGSTPAVSSFSTDLGGDPRVQACVVDMGADEAQNYSVITVSAGGSIQAAINAACDGHEIEVAPGTYYENLTIVGKSITLRSTAGPTSTIIDGQNLNTVITVAGSAATTIDGFTVTNGSFVPSVAVGGAALVMGFPVLLGASGILGVSSNLDVCNCIVTGNGSIPSTSAAVGGISFDGLASWLMMMDPNSATITNTLVYSNVGTGPASSVFGSPVAAPGGISSLRVNTTIRNSTIAQNIGASAAPGGAGGIAAACLPGGPSCCDIVNSIVWFNQSPGGPALDELDEDPFGYVSLGLPATIAASYSNIRYPGTFPGTGNLSQDPLLSPMYVLNCASPCRDSGDAGAPSLPATDLLGQPRIVGAGLDMGALELQSDVCYPGSGEDFVMTITVNGTPSIESFDPVQGGDYISVGLDSPAGGFDGRHILLLGQLFPTGQPLSAPAPFTGQLHVDGMGTHVLFGDSSLFGPVFLPPFGVQVPFFMPNYFPPGTSVMLQAIAIAVGASSANGLFAITDGHELRF